jgi:hypothetical protein
MQFQKISVLCECGSESRHSVDELLAHLGKRTGLSPDFFRSSNLTDEEKMEQQADDEMKYGEEREAHQD